MNDIVKAGLAIMRDPNTCQTTGALKRVDKNGNECFCAIGCMSQASVQAGIGRWVGEETSTISPTDPKTGDYYQEYIDWENELHGVIPFSVIVRLNDREHKLLPEIADVIEAEYAEKGLL